MRIGDGWRVRFDGSGRVDAEQGWPNSTGWPLLTRISVIVPETPAGMSVKTFIASMTQTVVSGRTASRPRRTAGRRGSSRRRRCRPSGSRSRLPTGRGAAAGPAAGGGAGAAAARGLRREARRPRSRVGRRRASGPRRRSRIWVDPSTRSIAVRSYRFIRRTSWRIARTLDVGLGSGPARRVLRHPACLLAFRTVVDGMGAVVERADGLVDGRRLDPASAEDDRRRATSGRGSGPRGRRGSRARRPRSGRRPSRASRSRARP